MTSIDSRVYATVLHSDHSLQYSLTITVTILATPLNFLSFFLILTKSKRQRPSFKICLFISQLSYYIAQFHLGVLSGLVTLHPFPGMYSVGILKDYLSCFTLSFIWCMLFGFYIYATFVVLLIRLRIVARPGKAFDCHNLIYNVCYTILAIYIFAPVPGIMALSYSSREQMEQFVRTRFPNNMMIFDHPGAYVFTNYDHTDLIEGILIFEVVATLGFVLFMYTCISREIRISMTSNSSSHGNENRKVLRNLVVQSVSYSFFLSVSVGLIFKSFYNDPSYDSRIPNAIAYTCLCGASIPCQIMMISRNTAYRDFVLRKRRRVSSLTPVHSLHRNSIFLKT